MEEKIINEKESIELIARMISDTKSRLEVGDGNILLYWGLLTVAVATIVWCAVTITGNAAYNGLWGLLAFGWLFNYRLTKEKKSRGYRSYTDKMCSVIWTTVGVLGLCGVVMCVVIPICYRLFVMVRDVSLCAYYCRFRCGRVRSCSEDKEYGLWRCVQHTLRYGHNVLYTHRSSP